MGYRKTETDPVNQAMTHERCTFPSLLGSHSPHSKPKCVYAYPVLPITFIDIFK